MKLINVNKASNRQLKVNVFFSIAFYRIRIHFRRIPNCHSDRGSNIFYFPIMQNFRRNAARRVVREYEVLDLHLIQLSGTCCVEVFYKTNCLGRSQFLPSGFLGTPNFHRVRSFQPANCDHVWQDFLSYL